MKLATVKFLSSKDEGASHGYTYLNTVNAKQYDAVLVPTRYGASLAVVESTREVEETDYTCHGGVTPYKSIHEVIKSKVVAQHTKELRKKDLAKTLKKMVKDLDEVKAFEMYAGMSPEFAELLEQYKAIK